MTVLSVETLREALDYNPETGVFVRKATSTFNPKVKPGMVAGSKYTNGYVGIRVGKQRYSAHRLAWFYVYGHWPNGDIDHINMVRDDNRIANLREATVSQNMANISTPKHNSSGYKGVYYDKHNCKWVANIQVDGKRRYLGRFSDKEDAAEAYNNHARHIFGDYARLNKAV